jgi:glycosyltransferase involved in cell wall biosynthesis
MRVLIVTSRFPLPPWRGNQVRTVEWLRALDSSSCGLVCLAAPSQSGASELAEFTERVWSYRFSLPGSSAGIVAAVAAGRPAQEGLYATGSARRVVTEAARSFRPDVVVVQMVRCAWALEPVLSVAPRAAVVFDAIDAMSLHFERAARSVAPLLRPLFRAEAERCRRREGELAARAHRVTAVCERDLAALSAPANRGRVVPVSGRAFDRSSPDPTRPTILLSGNLGYRPTVAGARWFADHVWPLLVQRVPGVRWLLVGSRPNREVRRLAELPGIELHTDVGDLAPFLAQTTAAIAPLSSGSGIPMKVLEAWAAGVPVVADQWAASGLDGEGTTAVAAVSTRDEWVAALERLLVDPEVALSLGNRGRDAWAAHYRFDRIAEAVRKVVSEAAACADLSTAPDT